MRNWKAILQSNTFFLSLFFFLFLFLNFHFFIPKTSSLSGDETVLSGKITNYKIDGDLLSFTLETPEKLQVFYTIKTEEEKEKLQKTIGYGYKVKVTGNLSTPEENTTPNTFNYKKYLYYNHIFYLFYASEIEITPSFNIFYSIKNSFRNFLMTFQNKEYFLAFLMGDTKTFDLDDLRSNGVSHLFAVSGMHISLFVLVLGSVLKKKKFGNLILLFFLFFYAFLVGFTPSVLRVVIMYALGLLNQKMDGILTNKKIFFLTLSILLFIDPFYLMNIGFQYSFLISFTFLYLKQEKGYFKSLLKTSFLAFLASLPISAMNFYEVNLLGILLNLIFVPFVSFLLYPACFIVLCLPFLSGIYSVVLQIFEAFNSFFANMEVFKIVIPNTSFLLWAIYFLVFFLYLKSFKKKYFILLIFIFSFIKIIPKLDFSSYVYFLDVGQGDSALIISPNQKEVILIDTGGKIIYQKEAWQERVKSSSQSETLITFFHSLGISKLDYLLLTHGDFDHMGNAINIVNDFKVKKAILNCGEYNDLEKEFIKVLEKKKVSYSSCIKELNLKDKKLYFLNTKKYDNENDNSSVIYAEINHYKFLFMGDASVATEKEILNKYKLSNIDVLKVGHHGSKTSSSEKFISTIKPKYSIISVGKNNRYGHPNTEILGNLVNSKIYRTDIDGSIMFKIKKDKLEIKTCSP